MPVLRESQVAPSDRLEDLPHSLPGSQTRGRRSCPDVFHPIRPARDVLRMRLGVVPDERHLIDHDAKQCEPADDRLPADLPHDGRCVMLVNRYPGLLDRATNDLDLHRRLGAVTTLFRTIRSSRARSIALVDRRIIDNHRSPSMINGSTALIRAMPARRTVPMSKTPGSINFSWATPPSVG